jgi:uncharacterized membrane protein
MQENEEAYLGSPDNPKTAAVVCYITLIGWIIAYFAIYKNNKTALAAYHLRQALLLHILLFVINGLGYWTTNGFIIVFDTLWFILWLWGFISAIYQRRKPIPLIGEFAQSWFSNV